MPAAPGRIGVGGTADRGRHFPLRPELNDLWDFRIFIDIEPDESIRRGVAGTAGDGEAVPAALRAGQRLYLDAVRPAELADVSSALDWVHAVPDERG